MRQILLGAPVLVALGATASAQLDPSGGLLAASSSNDATLYKLSTVDGSVLDSLVIQPKPQYILGLAVVGPTIFLGGYNFGEVPAGMVWTVNPVTGVLAHGFPTNTPGVVRGMAGDGAELVLLVTPSLGHDDAPWVERWTSTGQFLSTTQLPHFVGVLESLDTTPLGYAVAYSYPPVVRQFDLTGALVETIFLDPNATVFNDKGPLRGLAHDDSDGSWWAAQTWGLKGAPQVIRRFAADGTPMETLPWAPQYDLGALELAFEPCSSVPSSQLVRLGDPPNPAALLPDPNGGPQLATTWRPVVDHGSFAPGALADWLLVTAGSANVPAAYGTWLVDLASPTLIIPTQGPGAPFAVAVPLDCALVGAAVHAQAVAFMAGGSIELTNALDVIVGTD